MMRPGIELFRPRPHRVAEDARLAGTDVIVEVRDAGEPFRRRAVRGRGRVAAAGRRRAAGRVPDHGRAARRTRVRPGVPPAGLDPLAAAAQLVFVDLRGQGRSSRPPLATCTLEQMADDVAELCHALGITSPVVFGHSAGGFIALHLALRHQDCAP